MENNHSMTHDDHPSITQQNQSGCEDPVLQWMRLNEVPLTRETYLNLAYMGNPPKKLGPEEEAELPDQFQRWEEE